MHLRWLYILLLAQVMFCYESLANDIVINSVKAGNNQDLSSFVEIPLSDSVAPVLRYDQNYLIFNFSLTSFVQGESIFYKMEGLDYNWIECEDCKQIQYAHLDGGEYTLLLKRDLEKDNVTEFSFRIEGNIWHQWWFVPLLLLFVLGICGIGLYFLALFKMRQEVRSQLLVHKERLAAMVDLTAGVAHEIQNPLNFVNNFAEVSSELIVEAEEELNNNEVEEAKDILSFIKDNLAKIGQHGGRASSIIREMQQHSKPISTVKELTDMNVFFQEYIDMAHSTYLESKDAIHVEVETVFDDKLPSVNIAPDEMKRVLLNMLSNAFYACSERSSRTGADHSVRTNLDGSAVTSTPLSHQVSTPDAKYSPLVTITTRSVAIPPSGGQGASEAIEVTISDNGIGMSQETIDKVFQPFFTTKPTGTGTGLGMSISYDIITKGHGGTIEVKSMEGEGTTFTITLPISHS